MEKAIKQNQGWFQEWANEYDNTLGKVKRHHKLLDLVVRLSGIQKGDRVLDIGCGNGNLIIQLAQAFKNSSFVGINPDVYGIEDARKTISQTGLDGSVAVENIGGEDLEYQDEFDMISMVFTLHEIFPDIRPRVMEKAYQALKSGGWLLIRDFPPYPTKLEDFRNPLSEYAILDQFFEVSCQTFPSHR